MLLCRTGAFALQIRQNLGPDDFALLIAPAVHASAKSLMPLQPHSPTSFCLISAEAGLPTWKMRIVFFSRITPRNDAWRVGALAGKY
jgi:hypothetical protein